MKTRLLFALCCVVVGIGSWNWFGKQLKKPERRYAWSTNIVTQTNWITNVAWRVELAPFSNLLNTYYRIGFSRRSVPQVQAEFHDTWLSTNWTGPTTIPSANIKIED